jgi:7-cyano-7-deazaguanine synthase
MKAVVLLSGGLDSYTAAAIARSEGFSLYALTVDYGQRHAREVEAARRVAGALGVVRHLDLKLDLRGIGGSALTGDLPVPRDRDLPATGIPATYVPARNTIFLALALGWAEVVGARDLVIGVNALDYSGYPDCRPEFIAAFESLAVLATRAGVEGARIRVHAPLATMSKADIIRRGVSLGLDYGLTHSCYDPAPDGSPCGRCDSCVLRAKGFAEAGVPDPLLAGGPRQGRRGLPRGPRRGSRSGASRALRRASRARVSRGRRRG